MKKVGIKLNAESRLPRGSDEVKMMMIEKEVAMAIKKWKMMWSRWD